MVCSRCGSAIEAQDRFCDRCGGRRPEMTPPPTAAAWSPPPPPPFPAQYGAPRPSAPQYGASPMAGGRAIVGGLVAIGSAWLPWIEGSPGPSSLRAIDATDMSDLACGYYLFVGGGMAVACGLLLLLRVGKSTPLPLLLAIGAFAGSALVLAVEAAAFERINGVMDLSIGYGLYVGVGAGVLGVLGGLLGLLNRRA
jgi:hypothetical protein